MNQDDSSYTSIENELYLNTDSKGVLLLCLCNLVRLCNLAHLCNLVYFSF